MNEPPPIETKTAALTPPADAAKLARLYRKARRWQRFLRLITILPFIGWAIGLGSLLLHRLGVMPPLPDWTFNAIIILPIATSFFGMMTFRWRAAVKQYQSYLDLQAVGLIVEGLTASDNLLYSWEVLTEMLPRLQANDAHLLTQRHHHILNRQLTRRLPILLSTRTPFILATLKAYEQIGGTEDLPAVERLAKGEGSAKQSINIRKAAQECLPYLQARSEVQDLRQNLLRASSESADSAATLLRPAAASSETAPHELLRPAEPEAPRKRNEA